MELACARLRMNKVVREILLMALKGLIGGVVLGVSFYVLLFFLLGPSLGLPPSAPKNATQTVIVVTQSGEISKVSSLILTVEGILLGLSPLFFDRLGRSSKLGAGGITLTAVALVFTLLTILFADTNASSNVQVVTYLFTILGLLGVASLYVYSAWKVAFSKSEETSRSEMKWRMVGQ
jgi:hypothetical protein